MSKLVIFLPDVGEVPYELTEAKISVGRTEDNAIFINDASVSVHHAEFVLTGGEYVLRDLGSTNGIRVNGKPANEAKLCPGDRVRFGSVEGVFEPDAKGASQPLPPREEALSAMPASQSQRPSDFGNSSPFTRKAVKKDPAQKAAFAAGAFALLVCLVAVYYVFAAIQVPTF
ncbi:MAG: FHA domain-containing protein [Chthoniobacteraceae bacterium]|nr:FHA domain-containing protein [Chthoniobacteraceae bacterium]